MLCPSECSPLPSSHFRVPATGTRIPPSSWYSLPLQSLCVCSSLCQELFSLYLSLLYTFT